MTAPDLILLRRFRFEYEARIAHDVLRDAGIESMVQGEVFDAQLSGIRDVSVLVRPHDVERARHVLEDAARHGPAVSEDDDTE